MWHEYLRSEGAQFSDDHSVRFPAAESDARALVQGESCCPLTDRAWIEVSGADARRFLQGQLTNDMEKLAPDRWQWSGMCNAKGRLLAVLRALGSGPDVRLELPRERAAPILAQLRKYVLRAKAAVDPLAEDLAAIGTHGGRVAEALQRLAGGLPERDGDVLARGETLLYRLPGPQARFVAMAPVARLQDWWRALRNVAAPAGSSAWRWLDIVSGLPQVYAPTAEEFVPQMMNLDLLDAISFKKGCYTGQEIVARMHYLGRLKQRMLRFHLPAGECAKPGDRLFPATGGDQPAGTVVDCQPAPERGCDLLAVVQLAALTADALRLHHPGGAALERRDLPYSLPLDG